MALVLRLVTVRGGRSTHTLYLSRSTDACVKRTLIKVEVLTQVLYSSKGKVQVLKCTPSDKAKSFPLKDISTNHFYAKLTELHLILV